MPTPTPPQDPGTWRRLRRLGAPRPTKANALAAVLAVALGFALATQIQATSSVGLSTLREDELVRVLDDLGQRAERLDGQVRDLQAEREALSTGADTAAQAAEQASRRLEALRVLAGTVPARGPGVRLTLTDPPRAVTAPTLLDVVQELRDAGAEVIQVGPVRLVAGSFFTDTQGSVTVDGRPLERPFVILAIGESTTLASALNIPGGIVDTVRRVGATATVETLPTVTVDALATPAPPRVARAVSDPPAAPPTQ